jgi:hypothetical protein
VEPNTISMVQECVDQYQVSKRKDEGIEISIIVPQRFKNLWMVRLSELTTTPEEIEYYEKD